MGGRGLSRGWTYLVRLVDEEANGGTAVPHLSRRDHAGSQGGPHLSMTRRKVERSQGGLVSKAHRLDLSLINSRFESNEEERIRMVACTSVSSFRFFELPT